MYSLLCNNLHKHDVYVNLGILDDMPRHLPSGSQLPACWDANMDEAICYADAKGFLDTTRTVRLVKDRFPDQLRAVCWTFVLGFLWEY